MKIEGTIHIGEATAYADRACARLSGKPAILALVVMLVILFIAIMLAGVIIDIFGAPEWAYIPILVVVGGGGGFAALRFIQAQQVKRFAKALMERGVENPLPTSLVLTTDGLVYEIGLVCTTTQWNAVSDILIAGPYWVLTVQGSATFLPKRYFQTMDQERAFISALLSHLTDDARARSTDAVRFVSA